MSNNKSGKLKLTSGGYARFSPLSDHRQPLCRAMAARLSTRFSALHHWIAVLMMLTLLSTSLCFPTRRLSRHAAPSSSTRRFLNRVFFEREELLVDAQDQRLVATLAPEDHRFEHITQILKLEAGSAIKCGVVNKGICDSAEVLSSPVCLSSSTANSSTSRLTLTSSPLQIALCAEEQLKATPRPRVDLILATPRPLRLERILPILACLGVRRLFLVGAEKVEKDYFGSHLFRRPRELRQLLVEGLSQASSDCHLPEVFVHKNLFHFLLRDAKKYFPGMNKEYSDPLAPPPVEEEKEVYLPLIAHPPKPESSADSQRLFSMLQSDQITSLSAQEKDKLRVVLAIGPEGGWAENEVQWFRQKGFHLVDLGPRILRTDIAVPVLLGMVSQWLSSDDASQTV